MPNEYNLDVDEDCPICCEQLNHDLNFFPCQCGFQICSLCWNRIKHDEGNLCPNCRGSYADEPYRFKPLTEKQEELMRQRDQRSNNNIVAAVVKPKVAPLPDKEKLRDVRVMQKNLVFVVGLQPKLADESMLRKQEYFGRFGKIMKVAVNQCTTYAGVQGPSASAYVTFSTTEAALKCIQTIHGLAQDGRTLKATLGTTKYCSRFLNAQQCKLQDCMYLHEIADPDASFSKDDMQKQKHTEYERKLMDNFRRGQQSDLARREAAEREKRLREQIKKKEETNLKKSASKTAPHQEAKRPRKPTSSTTTVTIPKQNQNPRSRPAPEKPKSPPKSKQSIYVDSEEDDESEKEEDVKDSWDTSDEEELKSSGKSSKGSSLNASRGPSRNSTPITRVPADSRTEKKSEKANSRPPSVQNVSRPRSQPGQTLPVEPQTQPEPQPKSEPQHKSQPLVPQQPTQPVGRLPNRVSPVHMSQPPVTLFDPFSMSPMMSQNARLGTSSPQGMRFPESHAAPKTATRSPPGFTSSAAPTSATITPTSTPFNPFDSIFADDPNSFKSQEIRTGGSLFSRLPTVEQLQAPFRKPPISNGIQRSFATPPGFGQDPKDWDNQSRLNGVNRRPPAGLFETGSNQVLIPGLGEGERSNLFGRSDSSAASLMPRPIPDLLRNGSTGNGTSGRVRQDSADFENLDFDPIEFSMNGLSKLQMNEPRQHPSPPQQTRNPFADHGAPSGMLGLFDSAPSSRQGNPGGKGLWEENLRRLLPNVNVHFAYNEQMSRNFEVKSQFQRSGPPPGFNPSPMFTDGFTRQNRQPVESEFIPKGLLD